MTGPELRSRRLRLGLNRDQLAHAVGVDANDVAQWEEGAAEIRCPRAVEQILRQNEWSVGSGQWSVQATFHC